MGVGALLPLAATSLRGERPHFRTPLLCHQHKPLQKASLCSFSGWGLHPSVCWQITTFASWTPPTPVSLQAKPTLETVVHPPTSRIHHAKQACHLLWCKYSFLTVEGITDNPVSPTETWWCVLVTVSRSTLFLFWEHHIKCPSVACFARFASEPHIILYHYIFLTEPSPYFQLKLTDIYMEL